MGLADNYRLLQHAGSIDLENAINFLMEVYPICNNGKVLDEKIALKTVQSEFMGKILGYYLNEIDSNPLKFGLSVTKLYSKEGKLLKLSVEEINTK